MNGQIHDPYAVPMGKDSLLPTEYKNLGRSQKQSGVLKKSISLAFLESNHESSVAPLTG
jgi:hypothetical protein